MEQNKTCDSCVFEGHCQVANGDACSGWTKKMEWTKVYDDNMKDAPKHPPHGQKVIAFYKNKSHGQCRRIMAKYVQGITDECQCEDECNCEYSELNDNYYYPEGWYEVVDNWNDWAFIPVEEGEVSYWMPLPDVPSNQ